MNVEEQVNIKFEETNGYRTVKDRKQLMVLCRLTKASIGGHTEVSFSKGIAKHKCLRDVRHSNLESNKRN